ncbi:MAG: tetratricopeptide repeat protein [Mycobacteriales bacterium]
MTPEQVYEEFRCAELALELGQPLDAVRLLDPVVAAEPGSTMALELLARALFASAQLARAEQALLLLVERRPDDGWARFALARTLERQGRKDEAGLQRRLAAALGLTG